MPETADKQQSQQHQHGKKRVSKACDCCRKSKTKCDGQRPCSRCLQDGKICTYMTKKKADQMYPASYVDLLETRVSILVQSLNELLQISKRSSAELHNFCSHPDLLNEDGEFDINKVICNLLPKEKLDNLAESSQDYSIDQITHVSGTTSSRDLSGSSSPKSLGAHSSLAKARRNSDNHVHKIPVKSNKHHDNLSSASLQSRLSITTNASNTGNSTATTTPPTSSDSPLSSTSSSLDIFKQPKKVSAAWDSLLYPHHDPLQELDLDSINFSDSNTTLMSPVYSFDDNMDLGSATLDSTLSDVFSKQNVGTQGQNSCNVNANVFLPKGSGVTTITSDLPIRPVGDWQLTEDMFWDPYGLL